VFVSVRIGGARAARVSEDLILKPFFICKQFALFISNSPSPIIGIMVRVFFNAKQCPAYVFTIGF
jgi:hypothetical protein